MLVVVTDEIATHLRRHNDARLNILYAQKLPFIAPKCSANFGVLI